MAALFDFCDLHASRWRLRRPRSLNASDFITAFNARPMYYDRQGFPIPGDDAAGIQPVIVWARLREHSTIDQVRVARDELPDGSWLSTVWLGIDHQYGLGPPMIFETMRFAGEISEHQLPEAFGGGTQQYHESMEFPDPFGEPGETTEQLRYATEEEAAAAHHEIVRRLRIREGH